MNLNQLIALSLESEPDKNIGHLTGDRYNHIPELSDDLISTITGEWVYWDDRFIGNERACIRWIKRRQDGRRCWELGVVWYDDKPVMLVQNAGREGSDFDHRYIIDTNVYSSMVRYLYSLLVLKVEEPKSRDSTTVVTDLDAPNRDYVEFYGTSIETADYARFSI